MPKVEPEAELVFVGVKVPRQMKDELEQYAKTNGFSMSYVIRLALEAHIVSPELPPQSQLWRDHFANAYMNGVLSWTLLERMPFLYQTLRLILETLGREDLAEKLSRDEEKLSKYLDDIFPDIKMVLDNDIKLAKTLRNLMAIES